MELLLAGLYAIGKFTPAQLIGKGVKYCVIGRMTYDALLTTDKDVVLKSILKKTDLLACGNQLTYAHISAYKNSCPEMNSLYAITEKTLTEYIMDEKKDDIDDAKNTKKMQDIASPTTPPENIYMYTYKRVASMHQLYARRLCRRAMLRNGYFVLWAQSYIVHNRFII